MAKNDKKQESKVKAEAAAGVDAKPEAVAPASDEAPAQGADGSAAKGATEREESDAGADPASTTGANGATGSDPAGPAPAPATGPGPAKFRAVFVTDRPSVSVHVGGRVLTTVNGRLEVNDPETAAEIRAKVRADDLVEQV